MTKLEIDSDQNLINLYEGDTTRTVELYSDEGFELISKWYLKLAWNQKYVYTFSWLGRPIIQLPDDMVRIQELIVSVRPDVIVECGVAHGGSLVLYASICKALGRGRVIGIDIEIRPHNRTAIEQHCLFDLIELIEGSSTEDETFELVRAGISDRERVLVILDSNHSFAHVLRELELYSQLVSKHSYIVVADGCMSYLTDVPRGKPEWALDNPISAITEFVTKNPDFVIEEPACPFNESTLDRNFVTHWPRAYVRRLA